MKGLCRYETFPAIFPTRVLGLLHAYPLLARPESVGDSGNKSMMLKAPADQVGFAPVFPIKASLTGSILRWTALRLDREWKFGI